MESKREIKILSIIALFVAVIGLTVAFAAMSRTLTINGTASIESANWDVRLKPGDNAEFLLASAGAEVVKQGTITDTSITDFELKFTKPGDKVTLNFYIENAGDINALIESFELYEFTCEGTGSNAEKDAKLVCDNLKITYDETGLPLYISEKIPVYASSQEGNFWFDFTYDKEATELPTNPVTIKNLGLEVKLVQYDGE